MDGELPLVLRVERDLKNFGIFIPDLIRVSTKGEEGEEGIGSTCGTS